MSAGAFEFVGIEISDTETGRVRIQPETQGLTIGGVANAALPNPTGQADRVLVSAGRRRRGVKIAPKVRFTFTGTPPTGYRAGSVLTLPLLNDDIEAEADEGATGTYLGATIQVAGRSARVGY